MYRSVRFYSFHGAWPESEQQLAENLTNAAFTPCGPLTERSSGWETPAGDPAGLLARRVGGADMLRLRTQLRVLPAAAIDEALVARLDEYRERMRQEPSRRAKRQLKEQTRDELMPKALLKSERIGGFCIYGTPLIGIDAATESRAERFVNHLRGPLAGVAIKPLAFKRSVSLLLTQILNGSPPPGFAIGRECRLHDPADQKASVRFVDMDLGSAAVGRCLKDGMEITHLGLEFSNVMSCVLDANGTIGKLRFGGIDAPDRAADEDPLARFDSEAVLMTGTLRQFVEALERVLGAGD
jgi:recombination associated protein RdgC